MQYTSRAAQQYKQQLEKDVAKFDTTAYLATLKGKPAEPPSVTAAMAETDKEAVAVNGNASSRPSSQNGSASNLAALDDSSVDGAPASSTASVTSAQGTAQLGIACSWFTRFDYWLRLLAAGIQPVVWWPIVTLVTCNSAA